MSASSPNGPLTPTVACLCPVTAKSGTLDAQGSVDAQVQRRTLECLSSLTFRVIPGDPLLCQGLSSCDASPPILSSFPPFSRRLCFSLPFLPTMSRGATLCALLSPIPLAAPQAQDSHILSAWPGFCRHRGAPRPSCAAPPARLSAPYVRSGWVGLSIHPRRAAE